MKTENQILAEATTTANDQQQAAPAELVTKPAQVIATPAQVIAKNAHRVPRGFTLPLGIFRWLLGAADRAALHGAKGRIRRGLTGAYSVCIVTGGL